MTMTKQIFGIKMKIQKFSTFIILIFGLGGSVSGNEQVDAILNYFECDNILKNWIENSTAAIFDVENSTLTVDLTDLQEKLW